MVEHGVITHPYPLARQCICSDRFRALKAQLSIYIRTFLISKVGLAIALELVTVQDQDQLQARCVELW